VSIKGGLYHSLNPIGIQLLILENYFTLNNSRAEVKSSAFFLKADFLTGIATIQHTKKPSFYNAYLVEIFNNKLTNHTIYHYLK